MQKRINILENDVQRCQKQSLDFELKLQHEKERRKCESSLKSVCETLWILMMEKLESENVSLEFQVQSLIKERENVTTEYQKLIDSIKRTRTQPQREINELIENVNQKTYAYVDVRAQNQDLLITISELKAKLKNVEKGLRAISSVKRPSNRDSSFKNSVLSNTKNSSDEVEVSHRSNKKSDVASKNADLNKKIVTNDDIKNALIAKNVLCVLMRLAGDGVAGIKRRRNDLSSDGVRNLATTSGHGRLKEDPETSTWRRRQDYKATPSR
ncbi:hypothetical protein Tco_1019359 [Tanacetum coccineum]|uniref:Uncharacterized protein n=1 Tax=Tanacetum coccineum TaxID=301880 RepID=A0ABQ5FYL6_9ASTR